MNSKNKIMTIAITLLSMTAMVIAKPVPEQRARIQGQMDIPSCDTVTFVHHTFYSAVSQLFRKDTTFVLDDNGCFDFQADVTHPVYIAVHPVVDGKKLINTGNYNVFLVLPGDDVFLSFNTDTVKVWGKGSEKYEAIIRISSPNYLDAGTALARSRERQTLSEMILEDFQQVEKLMDSLYAQKCRLLDQYRTRLTAEEYQLMAYDLEADFKDARISALYLFSNGMKPESRKLIYELKKPYLYPFVTSDSIDGGLKAYTQHYTTYLIRRLAFWNKTRIPERLEPVELDRVFDEITKNYSGLLRERLIMEFLLSLKTNHNIDPYVGAARKYIKKPTFLEGLATLDKAKRGEPFYTFNLPDSSGNYVNAERFRGKYLLIDFWFTGCLYCTVLTRRMADDVERWMTHPDFQMISVSIDKSPDVWKSSLAGGKYSHPGTIDVYTKGLGGKHPFIRYYSVENYPTLLLVGPDGKVLEIESGGYKRIGAMLNEQLK